MGFFSHVSLEKENKYYLFKNSKNMTLVEDVLIKIAVHDSSMCLPIRNFVFLSILEDGHANQSWCTECTFTDKNTANTHIPTWRRTSREWGWWATGTACSLSPCCCWVLPSQPATLLDPHHLHVHTPPPASKSWRLNESLNQSMIFIRSKMNNTSIIKTWGLTIAPYSIYLWIYAEGAHLLLLFP